MIPPTGPHVYFVEAENGLVKIGYSANVALRFRALKGVLFMGYSGFTEHLCAEGHYSTRDAYDSDLKACPACGAAIAYVHGVDQTNGYDESEPYSCCAPKEEIGFDDVWQVDHYGNRYATKRLKYRPLSAWVARIKAEGSLAGGEQGTAKP